ncbi:pentapeptide repeat-containing protein [Saccharothrix saharensis]|uniref:pentapeptide repeat-containing protein n=1 Tax=Saccharothrix saharensis TaxID=571190 RepID=UPI00368A56AD
MELVALTPPRHRPPPADAAVPEHTAGTAAITRTPRRSRAPPAPRTPARGRRGSCPSTRGGEAHDHLARSGGRTDAHSGESAILKNVSSSRPAARSSTNHTGSRLRLSRLRPTPPRPHPEQPPTRWRRLRGPWNWTAIAALIAALAAAGGLVYTGRSLDITGRSLDIARAQNQVAEQGQLTDRFTKAVDQLDRTGDDHLQARLGGIYALERLARDSPRDHPTIVEVLSAFIRSTTPRTPAPDGRSGPCPDRPPAVDVQAALTVLGRRDPDHDNGTHIDLTQTCLRDTSLHHANLSGAQLVRVDLTGTNLHGANLTDTWLNDANLTRTNLTGANLTDASLTGANLTAARLIGTQLYAAILNGATFNGATFKGANLTYANLNDANLNDAVLVRTDLTGAIHDDATSTQVKVKQDVIGAWW